MVTVSNRISRNPLTQLLQELAAKPWRRRLANAVTTARGAVDTAKAHPLLDATQWRKAVNASVRAGLHEMPRIPKPTPASADEDTAALTARIEQALRVARPADALDASARLLDLTPADERACELRARILAASGHEVAALALISAWTRRHGQRPALSGAAATISEQQGRVDEAERSYASTLAEHPNDGDTLERWLALRRARGGMEGYLAALQHIAGKDGAWRARLLLGRWCLERGDTERARSYYAQGIDAAADEGQALAAVSHDLLDHRRHDELRALIQPRYAIERHGPWAGLDLLASYTATGDLAAGRALLDQLFERHRHVLRGHLQGYANAYMRAAIAAARARAMDLTPTAAAPVEAAVHHVAVELPPWFYGLRCPTWLVDRAGTSGSIGFVALGSAPAEITVGLPLYLAEAFTLRSGVAANAVVSVRAGEGPVARDSAAVDEVVAIAAAAGPLPELLVACSAHPQGAGWRLELTAIAPARREAVARFTRTAAKGALGTALHALEDDLRELLELGAAPADGLTVRLPAEAAGDHAACLTGLFRLMLAQGALTGRQGVTADCRLFERAIAAMHAAPGAQLPRLCLTAALALDEASGSTLHRDYAAAAAEVAAVSDDPESAAFMVSPLLLWISGDGAGFAARRDQLLADADGGYREWLERIGQPAEAFVVVED